MSDATGVRWVPLDAGTPTRTFSRGRSIGVDGYGDWLIQDGTGSTIASRRRADTKDIEVIYPDDDA